MKTQKQRIFSILAILSLVVILSFIFVACNSKGDQSSEKPDMEATEIYKSVDPSVAFLLVQKKDGSYASGSGFFIDPHGTLVTNYHVIEDGIKCAVQMKNGNTVEVKTVVSYDEDADLAILATNVANTKPITESKSLPQVGETVYAIGYPEAFKLGIASSTFTSGIVSSYRTMDGNEYIQSTVNITHGNSGGVLINKKGDVVGITSSGITYGDIDYMNLSIPISKIHNLAVESNEPLDVVTARHYPVYATFYAHDLVFDEQELDYENTADYPGTVQKEGYTFDGWYADKAFTQEWDFSTQITKDTAIFAKLDPIYFSLNLDLNGGVWESNNPGDKYYIKNCEKALPIPKKTGYVFDGWTDSNGNYIDNYPSYSNARKLTLTANWVEGTPGLTFQLNDDGTATVTACDKSKSNIVIPTIYREHKVTSIAPSAFADCKSLQSIVIPDSVTTIGSYAFSGCSSLESLTIPFVGAKAGVTSRDTYQYPFGYIFGTSSYIGGVATEQYYYSGTLVTTSTTYYIPSSLKSVTVTGGNILYGAFYNCNNITNITLGDDVTSIGSSAFYNCTSWRSISVDENNPNYKSIDGNLYSKSGKTLVQYAVGKTARSFVIPDSVTTIGSYAFYKCTSLTSIVIPDSVTNIGGSAFSGCSGLTNIAIPDSVTSIGGYTFSDCKGLMNVTIPDRVTSIGDDAFSGCSSLTSITIPDSVTSIGWAAFSGCSSLTSITIPFVGAEAGVTSSDTYQYPLGYIFGTSSYTGSVATTQYYYHYDGITYYRTYYIPSSLKSVTVTGGNILYGAFYNCRGLNSIKIPDSVTSIGKFAFYGCSGLTSITLPFVGASATASNGYDQVFGYIFGYTTTEDSSDSVSGATKQYTEEYSDSYNRHVYRGYHYYIPSSIKSVTITGGEIPYHAFYNCSGLTSVTIGDGVTSIGESAFSGCTGLTSVTIPDSVTSIGKYAFYNTAWYNNQPDGLMYVGKVAYKYKGTMPSNTSIIIKDGTISITGAAFYDCSGLTSITIPDSVTSIGNSAFYNCSGLTSVTIPDSVTSIGKGAFYGCSGLTSITLPFVGASATASNGYDQVFGYIFGYTTTEDSSDSVSGATMQYNDGYWYSSSSYRHRYYYYYIPSSIKSVTITGEKIPYHAFYNCSELASITIPDSVTSIGESAFYNCSELASIEIPDGVTSIGESAFSGCTGLTSVTIPDSVTTIGSYAFRNCSSLTSLTIPDSVTSIGWAAFSGCSGLTSVTIPDSVTSIGDYAFYNCRGLTNITIPDSVTSIGDYAFGYCRGLTCVTIPDSVTSISKYAFNGCSGLTSITIPNSVTSIGKYVFNGCSSLASITLPFVGTSKTASNGYDQVFGYIFGYDTTNSSSSDISGATYQYYDGNSTRYYYYIPSSIKSVTITGEKIPYHAFYNCSKLTNVTIGDSVTTIPSYAFYNCSALTSITIPDSVTTIGNYAFLDCTSLTDVYYTGDIAGWCGISGLGNLMSTSRTLYIGGNKVDGNLTIPDGVTSIGRYAFSGCTSLTSVTIPDSVTSIGIGVFSGCSSLESITIPFVGAKSGVTSSDTYQYPFGYIFGTSSGVATTQYYYGDSTSSTTSTTYYIPSSLKSVTVTRGNILYGAFYNCNNITNITLGDDVTTIGDSAFYNCSNLTDVYYTGDIAGWCGITFGNAKANPMYYADNLYIDGKLVEGELVISDIVTTIGNFAFWGCTLLTSIVIPDSVTSIGKSAFNSCDSLTSVAFGENSKLTTIGGYAFGGCSSLESLTIPFVGAKAGVTSSDTYQYPFGYIFGTSSYTGGVATAQYYYGDSTSSTTSTTYYIPSSLKSVTVTGGNILYGAFYNCSDLTSVTIGNGVTSIGEDAFRNCSSLTSVYYTGDIAGWCDITFGNAYANPIYYADNLYIDGKLVEGELVIPDIVTTIGNFAFWGCTCLTSVVIPDGVTTIGYSAFNSCTSLTSVTIGDGVTSIGGYAFCNCSNLATVTFAEGSQLETIGLYAFKGCIGLISITIPNSVINIGDYAFYNCSGLTTVFYAGTEEQWNAISIGSDNSSLTSATIVYNYDGVERTYSFVTNCEQSVDPITERYLSSLPTLTRDGYRFCGWYDNEAFGGEAVCAPYCSKDKTTLYAKWLTEEEWNTLHDGTSFEKAFIAESGQTYDVSITTGGQIVYFVFTPTTSGSFTIQSIGSGDTYGTLYSSSKSSLKTSDDDGDGNNFKITYTMTAGTTYYVAVKFYGSSTTGTFKVSFF